MDMKGMFNISVKYYRKLDGIIVLPDMNFWLYIYICNTWHIIFYKKLKNTDNYLISDITKQMHKQQKLVSHFPSNDNINVLELLWTGFKVLLKMFNFWPWCRIEVLGFSATLLRCHDYSFEWPTKMRTVFWSISVSLASNWTPHCRFIWSAIETENLT